MYKFFTLALALAVIPLNRQTLPQIEAGQENGASSLVYNFSHSTVNNIFKPAKETAESWSQNWLASAQENIRKSEYHFSRSGKTNTWCTPNRKNNLRFYYNDNGFSAEPRTTKIRLGAFYPFKNPDEIHYKHLPGWKINFELDKKQLGKGLWKVVENKAEYVANNITVQYINNDEGMRQNFVVSSPLSNSNELKINFSIKTKLKTTLSGNRLQFFHKKTNVLNYQDLKVWDATNKPLIASFKKNGNGNYCIAVDAKDAAYPITIDPISTGIAGAPDWLGDDADQTGAIFGSSVASAGDVNGDGYSDVIIGAPRYDDGSNIDEGRAFVYHGSAAGLSATPNSTPDDADQANAFFGNCVASAGDVNGDGYSDVIVGAYLYDDGAFTNEGNAFIYHGSATGLLANPSSRADDCDQTGARFGVSVACAGDVNGDGFSDVIIGASYFQEGANTREGRAYVYYGHSGGISASPDSTPDDGDQALIEFGNSVAGAGDVNGDGYSDVVIGAYLWDEIPSYTNDGKIFVYYGGAAGLSASPNNILDGPNENNANLGISVACAGDVNGDGYSDIIAGAPGLDDGANFDEGKAFIYFGSASGASASPNITLDDADKLGAAFGISVACAGDVNGDGYSEVIVGANLYDDTNTNEGVAFIYLGNAAGSMLNPACMLDDADQADAGFGSSVASAGDVNGDGYSDVIVGAYFYADAPYNQEGRAFVYHGSASGITSTPALSMESNQAGATMGFSVASAGDVNGDGYSDIIIGLKGYDNPQLDEGVAFIYHGSATGVSSTPTTTLEINQASAGFGYAVAGAGDVNGDGYADVIVGAVLFDNGSLNEGGAFVFHGSAAGVVTTIAAQLECNQANANMGVSVASAGDVNGDGYSDVIVGANRYDNPTVDEGAVFVYHGSPTGVSPIAAAVPEGNQGSSSFGRSVSSAGDVNGDGYSDVIVGSTLFDNGSADEGAAFIFHGSATGISTTVATMVESNQVSAWMGYSVAGAGDVNGDGYADVIVGAIQYDNGSTDEGAAFVYHGSATGISTTAATILESNQISANMGISVAGAGDVNGDGYSDVIAGSLYYDNGETDEGAAFVYHGSPTGINSSASATLESNQAGCEFGISVAGAGDVNGDGYSDVIVGAELYSNGSVSEGAAFVYYSNYSGINIRNNLRLYNNDLTTPINSSNFVFSNFGAGLYARSFLGRAKGKLVWETRLNYNAYSGTPITNSTFFTAAQASYTDMDLAGIELKNVISKISGGTYTKLRARIKYDPVTSITGQMYSPWRNVSSVIDANNLGILPIELISFNAAWLQKGKTARLNFTTDKESGICCFDIEKSADGFNFYSIGTLPAKNVSGIQSYSFIDNNANSKNQFYRLKIKGEAGKIEYSNIQQLQNDKATEILVFPNPTTDVLQLQLNKAFEKMNVQILNSAGQTVKQLTVPASNQTIPIQIQNLVPGKYWLILQSGQEKQILQFVKQ